MLMLVVIDFSVYSGTQVSLSNRRGLDSTAEVMRFDVVRAEINDSSVPSTLRDLRRLDPSQAVATRTFSLS